MKILPECALLLLATSEKSVAFLTYSPAPKPALLNKSQLNLVEMAESLQIFYTTALVAGVGYTQRMAGREDFKKDMAAKIASGDITPQQLVEEITVMAEEINASADVAVSAQMEVQKLLEETMAMQQRFELPSAEESSLAQFELLEEPEKVPVPLIAEDTAKKEETLNLPTFAVSQTASNQDTMLLDYELDVTTVSSLQEHEKVNEEARKNPYETIADGIVDIVADAMEAEDAVDDTNLIADALLAAPPSMRHKSTNNLNESDALKLAQEALASISETAPSSTFNDDEFITPAPPEIEPSMHLVKESFQIETTSTKDKLLAADKPKPEGPIRSSPLARLLCSELGVNLEDIYPGTGLKGRVIADDVREYAKQRDETPVLV